jgi:hypothetical protein
MAKAGAISYYKNMHVKKHKYCRICGNEHLTEVLDLGKQYIQGAFDHPDSPSPPRRKVSNRIVRCDTSKHEDACGLIQADVSVSPEILYRNYWYQSGISQTMRLHLKSIADEAQKITGFTDGLVVDIGCNDGSLLRNYPETFKRIGVDPSDIAAKQTGLQIINETFPTNKLKEFSASIVTSIACFYDVNEPHEFVDSIRRLLNFKGIWVFEIAYLKSIIDNLAFDQFLAEHAVNYHLAPIEYLLKQHNLKLFRAHKTPTNGGSILCYVCHESCDLYDEPEYKNELRELRFEEFDACLDEEDTYAIFRENVNKALINLNELVYGLVEKGKAVHVYGASTKLNVLLEASGITSVIQYAAERSVEKVGAKTLSGISVISEESSRTMKPDFYLVGPYHFKEEIVAREKQYINDGGTLIFPLPCICLVSKNGEEYP